MKFWNQPTAVVTTADDVPRSDVTTPPVDLPEAYKLAGWSLVNDFDVWWYAVHPRHGKTDTANLCGNRPDLSIRRLVKEINLLDPQGNLSPTAVSHRLTAVNERIANLERQKTKLRDEIERLADQRCNGRIRYRTANSGTVFVYTDHTAGVPCPYCGDHPEGKRLRKYHGEEQTVTADNAMAAVACETEYQSNMNELDRLKDTLKLVERLVWQMEGLTKVW